MQFFAHAIGVVPQRGTASYVLRKDKGTREALPPLTSQTAESHDKKWRGVNSQHVPKNKLRGEQLRKLFSPRIVPGLFMSACYPVTGGNSLTEELGILSRRAFRNVRGM